MENEANPVRDAYYVADLNVRGELRSLERYDYIHIEQIPGASPLIAIFGSHIWRSPQEFEVMLPGGNQLQVRWRASSDTSGILTVRCARELASLSLLASGISEDADRITLEAFQKYLVRELHDTQTEPAFALLELTQRPLVATINFRSPSGSNDQFLVALADRCFAAAYFRYHGLA
jgi:hypothetical protein